jgi:hypothetical protein
MSNNSNEIYNDPYMYPYLKWGINVRPIPTPKQNQPFQRRRGYFGKCPLFNLAYQYPSKNDYEPTRPNSR